MVGLHIGWLADVVSEAKKDVDAWPCWKRRYHKPKEVAVYHYGKYRYEIRHCEDCGEQSQVITPTTEGPQQ